MTIASNTQRKVAVLSDEARRVRDTRSVSNGSRPRIKSHGAANHTPAPSDSAAGEAVPSHPLEPQPPPAVKVLLVDDDPAQIRRALIELERHGVIFEHAVATTESELSEQLRSFVPDVIVCDCGISGLSGLSVLNLVRLTRPVTPVVMVSSRRAQEDAIESLRWGATDYLLKSNWRRLGPAVQRAAEEARARVELTLRVEQLARCDAVTGLPYLTYVREQMQDLVHGALAAGQPAAIAVLKIDGLHVIEERFGRSVADEALRNIAGILGSHSPACDCIGRLDRGEFVVAFSGLEDGALEALIPRMLTRINSLRLPESDALLMSASAGVALCPQDQTHFEGLLSQAVTAQRVAGFSATASWRYYSDEMVSSARQRRKLQSELRDAIGGNELCLFYQPQFEVHTGRVCGIEALARWFPRGGESVAPSMFVPLAEEAGLIGQLGTWALREACQAAGRWGGARARERPILCVNVSTRQITPEFTAELAAVLSASGLPGEQLELEITESVLHRDGDLMMDCLAAWKRLGVRIAVDDFGTGYSSLSYLSRLPVDRLKIDRSLTQRMTSDARDVAIVRTIIALGRELGFTVLAEGIETQEQLAMLHELGCQQAQGYLLGRPIPAAQLTAFVGRGAQGKRPAAAKGQASPGRSSKPRGAPNRLKSLRLP